MPLFSQYQRASREDLSPQGCFKLGNIKEIAKELPFFYVVKIRQAARYDQFIQLNRASNDTNKVAKWLFQ